MASLTAFPKPKALKTVSVPAGKPMKLTIPKPPKMGGMSLPSMKTGGGPKLPSISVAAAHGYAKSAPPRAASSALPKAAAPAGWRNQGRTRRPQQASPMGFLSQ